MKLTQERLKQLVTIAEEHGYEDRLLYSRLLKRASSAIRNLREELEAANEHALLDSLRRV